MTSGRYSTVSRTEPPTGAVVVHPVATFDDLVVSADVMSQLLEAAARLEHRETVLERWGFLAGRPGREGLRLLFHGPPGTGKTLAGEVLAGALGRDLLVVDLSRMVSKWVGETEKHLAATFESAERTGSALLFDEADALFGRRTEVGDARDRYANLETAYLLSRIERFEGLVVLATNLRQNLDGAFARRLDFIVGFDPPDAGQRAQLWRRLLPPAAPLDPGVDIERLAALYAIPGGMIRSAAVSAGYLAAADGGVITAGHLVHAIRREYAKAGQHFPGEPQRGSARHPAGRASGGNGAAHDRRAAAQTQRARASSRQRRRRLPPQEGTMPPPTTLTGYYTKAKHRRRQRRDVPSGQRSRRRTPTWRPPRPRWPRPPRTWRRTSRATPRCGSRCPRRRCPPTPPTSSPSCSRT